VRVVFAVDEACDLLLATGFRKAISKLDMSDKARVRSALVDYHCMLKVKSEMDAFAEGLQVLGVLGMIKMYPDLFKPLFVADVTASLTAGKFPH